MREALRSQDEIPRYDEAKLLLSRRIKRSLHFGEHIIRRETSN